MAESKRFTRAEVAAHDAADAPIFIIHNHVYDVKEFLDEHPGGHEVLLRVVGTDASEQFDDISHSLDAKDLMKKFRIGELVEEEKTAEQPNPSVSKGLEVTQETDSRVFGSWKLPLLLGLLATVLYSYLFG